MRMRCLDVLFVVFLCGFALAQQAQAQSFSLFQNSPTVAVLGNQADDVWVTFPGTVPPLLPPPAAGFGGAGMNIEVDALSFGRPLGDFAVNRPAYFSVDISAFGAAGTAVAVEFGNAESSSDMYLSVFNGSNTLYRDGDGVATAPNPAVLALGVAEPATYLPQPIPPPVAVGDVDGLDLRANLFNPTRGPTLATYFSVDANTIASGVYGPGQSPGHIYVGSNTVGYDAPLGPGVAPLLFAAESALGLGTIPGNEVDAVIVYDNGDGSFQPGTDIVLLSLGPNSPFLGTLDPYSGLTVSEGDILMDAAASATYLGAAGINAVILHSAESLGLRTVRSGSLQNDNLNALDIIPEPASLMMILLGGAMLIRRRGV